MAGTALTGGGLLIGLSRVAPLSLAVLGATLVVAMVVLAFTGYKVVDRLLRHLEREPLGPPGTGTAVLPARAYQQESPGA
jgi:hypothetical protein